MANRNFAPLLGSLDRKLVIVDGTINIAADASVSNGTTAIVGAAVTKIGTGEYQIALSDAFNACKSINLTLEAATAVDLVPQIESVDVSSTKLVKFKLLAGATATNPSAACKVHVLMVLKNSSVTPA